MVDELAARRRGVKRHGWALVPALRRGVAPVVGYVVDIADGAVTLDIPTSGGGWVRARAQLSRVTGYTPPWLAPSGGEAA